jgi:hypothetical protein
MRPPTDTERKFYVLKFRMCWIFLRCKFLKKILTSKTWIRIYLNVRIRGDQ